MKTVYVKIALLSIIGMGHSVAMCMLQPKAHNYQKKATKSVIEVVNSLTEAKDDVPLALPPQRSPMQGNFFTELPKELRAVCVPSTKPNRPIPFTTRQLDLCRYSMWLDLKINISSTSMASRFVMLRDNPDLASYIRRRNGVRLEPNPTAGLKVSFERGLDDKAGLRCWKLGDKEEYERSYRDSMETCELMKKIRYNQENPPLIKCSIQ